ncbi:unnamed protein product [Nyctereutes procyonoides]|uniref:(raccoon dog) hypothetical protein n=1 Tax=Nyctereutes procyonoides TaxID=34880 RepID=A0A811ZZ78_NYCPR|nr:unnamed protein product [Nyctereutes procyonoides]
MVYANNEILFSLKKEGNLHGKPTSISEVKFVLLGSVNSSVCMCLGGGRLYSKLICRRYVTLYFVFCVHSSESELGILGLVQVHSTLAEMVVGGMVLETNMNEIVNANRCWLAGAGACAIAAVKNMNLPRIPGNITIGDFSMKVPNLPT